MINFIVAFERGRRKHESNLFKVKFKTLSEEQDKITGADLQFLSVGFIQLVKDMAAKVNIEILATEKQNF